MLITFFWFYSGSICCNILVGSIYPIHSLVVLVNEKWLWDSIFSLGIYIPFCTIKMTSLESQFDATYTDLLSFHRTMMSSFPVVVLQSISLHLNLLFVFCYDAITTPIFPHRSWCSNIIWSQKFEKTKLREKVIHENFITRFFRQSIWKS